ENCAVKRVIEGHAREAAPRQSARVRLVLLKLARTNSVIAFNQTPRSDRRIANQAATWQTEPAQADRPAGKTLFTACCRCARANSAPAAATRSARAVRFRPQSS